MKANINTLLPYYEALAERIYWKNGKPRWNANCYVKRKKDTIAGSKTKDGTRALGVKLNGKYKNVLAHKLRWYMETGEIVDGYLAHRNGKKDKNQFENLYIK